MTKLWTLQKYRTAYCNCKRQFLLELNRFNLDGTISYLMQYMHMMYTCVRKTQLYRNTNVSSLFLFEKHYLLIKKNTFRAFMEANSFIISSKSVFSISSFSILIKARSHNLSWFIEARRYERITFSQLAVDTTIVTIVCKAIRRFGKALHHRIQIWLSGGLQEAIILSCTTWY